MIMIWLCEMMYRFRAPSTIIWTISEDDDKNGDYDDDETKTKTGKATQKLYSCELVISRKSYLCITW